MVITHSSIPGSCMSVFNAAVYLKTYKQIKKYENYGEGLNDKNILG